MKKLFLFAFLVAGCSKPLFKSSWMGEKSPEIFTTRFETSKGSFDMEITRSYSPNAVDRFYQLLKHRFFDNTLFYRVRPKFVAQFGISDTSILKQLKKFMLPDEQVTLSNKRGTIAFARLGKNSRGTALFINLLDNNPRLDTIMANGVRGYPTFGRVIKGMETVDSLYSGYGDNTLAQERNLYQNRTVFLDSFPKLDVIHKAYVLKKGN